MNICFGLKVGGGGGGALARPPNPPGSTAPGLGWFFFAIQLIDCACMVKVDWTEKIIQLVFKNFRL